MRFIAVNCFLTELSGLPYTREPFPYRREVRMSLSELWSLYGQNYIDALLATWGMTLESFVIAMVLAVAVTVMRVSPLKPLRVFGDLYVQVFRNIPGIALLIIVVYALPPLKVVLPYRTCVIVATVLLGSAFGSENFMSGINTVGVGQVEAAVRSA